MNPYAQDSAPHRQSPTDDAAGPFPMATWREASTLATSIGDVDARVLAYIAARVDFKTGITRPLSLDEIAYGTGKDRDNVRKRHIPALEAAGWLCVVSQSRGRGSARRFRLTFGEYRQTWREIQASRAAENDAATLVGEKGVTVTPYSEERGVTVPRKGGHHDPEKGVTVTPPSLLSLKNSSSSAGGHVDEPAPGAGEKKKKNAPEGKTEPVDVLLAEWPRRRQTRGGARDNAADELVEALDAGVALDELVELLRADVAAGRVTEDVWPDRWAREAVPEIEDGRRRRAGQARLDAIAACDVCDDYGFVSDDSWRNEFGVGATQKCPHGDDAARMRADIDARVAAIEACPTCDRYGWIDAPVPGRPRTGTPRRCTHAPADLDAVARPSIDETVEDVAREETGDVHPFIGHLLASIGDAQDGRVPAPAGWRDRHAEEDEYRYADEIA